MAELNLLQIKRSAQDHDGFVTIFQHHCRKCGIVVCGSCSNHKSLLPHMSSKPLRVCDECYRSLNTKSVDSGGGLERMNSDSSSDDSDDEDEAAERNGADRAEVGAEIPELSSAMFTGREISPGTAFY